MSYFRPEIEAMAGYRPGEQPRAGKFIKLNTNENPYPPSPRVAAAVNAALERGLQLYPDPRADAFRHRAAELLGVAPDWILCGNGSDDILTIVTRALVGQGQRLRMPYPSYVLYHTLAEIQGARYEEIPFDAQWSLDARFASAAADLRLAFLPNPNSPSGTRVSRERIVELAEQLPCPLLVDEAYVDFADSSCVDLVAGHERILVSRTLSKSYALAGLRFGFLVAQPQLVAQFAKVKDSYNCDALSIAAATAAIDDQQWLAGNRQRVLATRRRLSDRLTRLGFRLPESHANFVWCTHAEQASESLYQKLKQQGVLVRYMDYPGWGDGLRVTVGSDEQIDAFLAILETLV